MFLDFFFIGASATKVWKSQAFSDMRCLAFVCRGQQITVAGIQRPPPMHYYKLFGFTFSFFQNSKLK